MAGTGDEVVLQVGGQVDEVGAVPGDADDEVTILLRILLGLLQGIGVDDVELDVPQLQVAPGTDELHQLFGTGIAFNALGSELHVDQTGSAGAHTVVLRVVVGEQDGGGTIVVGAVRRGRTVSQREPRHATVRGSGNNLTEGHVSDQTCKGVRIVYNPSAVCH